MTKAPLWPFIAIPMFLAGCVGPTTTSQEIPTAVPATAEPTTAAPTQANLAPTPTPQGTPESIMANATPTPAPSMETFTPVPTREHTTDAPTPTARLRIALAITVATIPADIPEYRRSRYKHWVDEDGDCQDARQEVLILESLVEVTFESERRCRVATGRWFGAFTGVYVEAPGDLDIDHLVPLKNAHDSGGWAWSSARKEEYANYLGGPGPPDCGH